MPNQKQFEHFIFFKFLDLKGDHNIIIAILPSLILITLNLVLTGIDGLWILEEGGGFLQDPGNWGNHLSMILLIYFLRKAPETFDSTFNLKKQGDLDYDSSLFQAIIFNSSYTAEDYQQDFTDLKADMDASSQKGRRRLRSFMIVGAIANLAAVADMWGSDFQAWGYQSDYLLTFIGAEIQNGIQWWLFFPEAVFILVSSISGMIRLLKILAKNNCIIPTPMSVTSRGGLTVVSWYSLYIVRLLLIPIVFLYGVILVLGFNLMTLLGFLFYILLLTGMFFIPLRIVHRQMKAIKFEEVGKLERMYMDGLRKYQELISEGGSPEEIGETTRNILDIQSMNKLINSIPAWPYDLTIIRKFITYLVLPLVGFVYNILTSSAALLQSIDSLKQFLRLG